MMVSIRDKLKTLTQGVSRMDVKVYWDGVKYIAIAGKISTKGHYLKKDKLVVKTPKKITERILTLRHDSLLRYIPAEIYISPLELPSLISNKGYSYITHVEGNRYLTNLQYLIYQFPELKDVLFRRVMEHTPSKIELKVEHKVETPDMLVAYLGMVRPNDDKWRIYYWYIRTPRFITHQYVRHTTFTIVQESMRRRKIKQHEKHSLTDEEVWNLAYRKYLEAYESGKKLEQARASLLTGTMSTMVVATPEFALSHWFAERLCIYAQKEHREIALAKKKILEELNLWRDYPKCRKYELGYCPYGKDYM